MGGKHTMNFMKLILPVVILVGLGGCSVENGWDTTKVFGFLDEAPMEATDISDFEYLAVYDLSNEPDRAPFDHLEIPLSHAGEGYIFKIETEEQWPTCLLLNNQQDILIEYSLVNIIDDLIDGENGYQVGDDYIYLEHEYSRQETWNDITMKLVFFRATVNYNYTPPSYSFEFALLLDFG